MSLQKTEALILKMFNWSESSRTVHFLTPDSGRLSLIDKGGRSMKSKRGRMIQFARLEVTFYSSRKESTGYISDVEILEAFTFEEDGSLGRLAYGSAACELLHQLLPESEAHPEVYSYLVTYLNKLSRVEKRFLPALFLTFFLRGMSLLGYHPQVAFCVGCENSQEEVTSSDRKLMFSPERGGLVCTACQKPAERYIGVSVDGLRLLSVLQRASLDEAAMVPVTFSEATLLVEMLADFLRYHSGLVSQLKALQFLNKLRSSQFG